MRHGTKGFSLIELIVVVAIMSVLVAVLAPSLLRYVEKARIQKDASAVSEVIEVTRLALLDSGMAEVVSVGDTITITAAGSISDSLSAPNTGNLAEEIKKMMPIVSFASSYKADVVITITSMSESPTFDIATSSSSGEWKAAIEAIH